MLRISIKLSKTDSLIDKPPEEVGVEGVYY